ncbi:unnamed protein product [Caenorhabditis angaria]|uniref:Uncharacterized protein n=1 Tax=Caenorhabditis angaria TaxID=860376 RepID=A0A9P1J0V4_9PELO|nr:unnamed protein product [Caenorhabditis angaria]
MLIRLKNPNKAMKRKKHKKVNQDRTFVNTGELLKESSYIIFFFEIMKSICINVFCTYEQRRLLCFPDVDVGFSFLFIVYFEHVTVNIIFVCLRSFHFLIIVWNIFISIVHGDMNIVNAKVIIWYCIYFTLISTWFLGSIYYKKKQAKPAECHNRDA